MSVVVYNTKTPNIETVEALVDAALAQAHRAGIAPQDEIEGALALGWVEFSGDAASAAPDSPELPISASAKNAPEF